MRPADARGALQWWSRRIAGVGILLGLAAMVADLMGHSRVEALDTVAIVIPGLAQCLAGIAITLASQVAMGASWRGDVDPDVVAAVVTDGPFRVVRNPILAGTFLTVRGPALVVPSVPAFAMLVALAIASEVRVRLVEEPYFLSQSTATPTARSAERTGRLIPGVGRWPSAASMSTQDRPRTRP